MSNCHYAPPPLPRSPGFPKGSKHASGCIAILITQEYTFSTKWSFPLCLYQRISNTRIGFGRGQTHHGFSRCALFETSQAHSGFGFQSSGMSDNNENVHHSSPFPSLTSNGEWLWLGLCGRDGKVAHFGTSVHKLKALETFGNCQKNSILTWCIPT